MVPIYSSLSFNLPSFSMHHSKVDRPYIEMTLYYFSSLIALLSYTMLSPFFLNNAFQSLNKERITCRIMMKSCLVLYVDRLIGMHNI